MWVAATAMRTGARVYSRMRLESQTTARCGTGDQLSFARRGDMNWEELWKLSGIVIVVVGLALRLRTTLVVVTAALVTGLVAGLPLFSNAGLLRDLPLLTRPVMDGNAPEGIINMLGRAFAEYRYVTLFIITLPAIGLAERFGL